MLFKRKFARVINLFADVAGYNAPFKLNFFSIDFLNSHLWLLSHDSKPYQNFGIELVLAGVLKL